MLSILADIGSMLFSNLHLVGLAGAAAAGIGSILPSWWKAAAVAAGIAIVGTILVVTHLEHVSDQKKIATLTETVGSLRDEIRTSADVNADQRKAIDGLTEDKAAADRRADTAAKLFADSQALIHAETIAVMKDISDAATDADRVPNPPGMRAVLRRLCAEHGAGNPRCVGAAAHP